MRLIELGFISHYRLRHEAFYSECMGTDPTRREKGVRPQSGQRR